MIDHSALSRSERQALELLPWYVNGTLAGDERGLVRRELRSSLTCRLEYGRLCRMQALMQSDDAEHAATDRAFERLMGRIQAESPAPGARPAASRLASRWLPLAQAATVLALVSGIAVWWSQDTATEPGTFVTLSAEQPADSQATRLRLVFSTGVPEDARRAMLAELGLQVIAPPTPDGIYTVALPENANAREIADRLRADPRIAFVTTPPASEGP